MCSNHWLSLCLQVLEHGYKQVIVFEDDLRFEPYFNTRVANLLEEIDTRKLDWELMWVGVKI